MDEQQQADLQTALASVEPPAESSDKPPEASDASPTEAPPVAPEAAKKTETTSEPSAPKTSAESYQQKLERIMAEQREKFEQTQKPQQVDPQVEHLRRIEEALKAQQEQPKTPTLSDLLADNNEDDKPDYVKKLEEKVALYDKKLADWEKQQEEIARQHEAYQRASFEQNEQQQIQKFIEAEAESFPYVAALRPMRSDADLYNGMISMYNQGYSPSHKDMADLVETRIESVLDHLADTPKFKQWLQKRNAQPDAAPGDGATLTGKDSAETPAATDPSTLTEEESIRLALQAAEEAAEQAKRSR